MSRRHRPGPEQPPPGRATGSGDPTKVQPVAGDDEDADLSSLARRAAEHLDAAAASADDIPRRVAADAVAAAVAEAVRIARRAYLGTVLGVLVVTIAVVVAGGVIANNRISRVSSQLAGFAAGDAASSEVTNARSSSLLIGRRDFANANAALVAAGLNPVPDPGPTANAQQMEGATGEALGALRAISELQKRGLQIPGVSAPDPGSAQFPGIFNGPTAGGR